MRVGRGEDNCVREGGSPYRCYNLREIHFRQFEMSNEKRNKKKTNKQDQLWSLFKTSLSVSKTVELIVSWMTLIWQENIRVCLFYHV